MARYHDHHNSPLETLDGRQSYGRRSPGQDYAFLDSRVDPNSLSTIAPGYAGDYGGNTSRTSLSIVRPAGHHHHGHREHERLRDPSPVTIQEPIIEHEHHHLHHHIDHGMLQSDDHPGM
jgi:hypothetical protein